MKKRMIRLGTLILTILLIYTGALAGIWLRDNSMASGVLFPVFASVLAVMAVRSRFYITYPKAEDMTYAERAADWKAGQAQMIENPEQSWKKMEKKYYVLHLWFFILFLAAYGLFVTAFAFLQHEVWGILCKILMILLIYIIWELLYFYIRAYMVKTDEEEGIVLDGNQYPYLKSAIDEVWKDCGIQSKLKVEIGVDEEVYIGNYGRYNKLHIGILQLLLYTKDELQSILYHEAGHVCKQDTERTGKMCWIEKLVDVVMGSGIFDKVFLWLFQGIIAKTQADYDEFMLQITLSSEKNADEYVKKSGKKQEYVNAGVKDWIYQLVSNSSDIGNQIFASPTVCQNMYSLTYESFKEMYEKRIDYWNNMALSEIMPRFNTHPTVRERMEAMGIQEYTIDYDFPEDRKKYPQYYKEISMLLNKCDEYYMERMTPEAWNEIREACYLPDRRTADAFEALTEEQKYTSDVSHLNEAARAFRNIGEYEKAYRICDMILEKDSGNTQAMLCKGTMLLENYDSRGLPYVKGALKNPEALEDALEAIFNFCISTGNQEELEAFYKYADAIGDQIEKL